MRKITVAKALKPLVPKGCKHTCHPYAMQAGTAWKLDPYGNHQVVEVDEAQAKKADHEDYCSMHFDGRTMVIFKLDGQEYLQPTVEDPRATEERLGSKRKKRKMRAPRREAPGVAPKAVSWENDAPEPKETAEERRRAKRESSLELVDEPRTKRSTKRKARKTRRHRPLELL